MTYLVAGLLLFFGVHSIAIVAPAWRDSMAAKLGGGGGGGGGSAGGFATAPRPGTSDQSSAGTLTVLKLWLGIAAGGSATDDN